MAEVTPGRILGPKVTRPGKRELAADVARLLNVEAPTMSKGSTVVSDLLDRIFTELSGRDSAGKSAYAKTAEVLQILGLTYDPYWDTSEAHGSTGGSTVTARAYSRMRAALSGVPRCFVLNSTDAAVGAAWETEKKRHYRYDERVTGRLSLNDAGPGSLVLYYNTSNHSLSPMSYTATARVQYINSGWKSPWDAELTAYRDFTKPVPARQVEIVGRNAQHAITEITWSQYKAILEAGGIGVSPESADPDADPDVGAERVAERIVADFPAGGVALAGDRLPDRRAPGSRIAAAPEREPAYGDQTDREGAVRLPRGRRSPRDLDLDKLVEERAVVFAQRHLAALGWNVAADRQKDGVGYDLEMTDGSRTVHLEVKGIRGPRVAFNLTAKEWWATRNDPDFVLAAVTDVLSPTKVFVNIISAEELAKADRVATQFRVEVARPRRQSIS